MQVHTDLMRKGALRLRGLAEDINRYADKCANYAGAVVPGATGATVEFEDFDSIINEVERSLWAIRTLDREVFEASDADTYKQFRETTPEGQVVLAFASLRDVATHRGDVVDPDIGRAVGPVSNGKFLIFPRWKQRTDLPADTFNKQHGGVYHTRIAAYDAHVAGRHVLDTLIDAFAFFKRCDDRLVRRTADGQIEGFLLPPLPVVDGYYRLGPDWPTYEQAERNLRQLARDIVPAGECRSIVGTIQAGTIVCGWTELGPASRAYFTESLDQVATDIGHGYSYVLDEDHTAVTAADHRLTTAAGCDLANTVPKFEASDEELRTNRWNLVDANADLYMRQRKGT